MPKIYRDPSLNRKETLVRERMRLLDGIPTFSLVEFNIYGSCNRKCSFCPISDPTGHVQKNEGITIELYIKIMKDLREIEYDGTLLYSSFCEPLLHPQLDQLIKISKDVLPLSRVEIVSNGDLIKNNLERWRRLYQMGLDTLTISIYDGPEEMRHFVKLVKELNLSMGQICLRRRYFQDGNYGMSISNRAGLIDSNSYRDEAEWNVTTLPLKRRCFYPFYQITIDYNGDVLLCPHDWRKFSVLGNARKQKLWDLWISAKYEQSRARLAHKDRNFRPCDQCDVMGEFMGREFFEAWKECRK